MDGRDIGSVVIPNANLKIYITASVEIRALRRNNQLNQNGKRSTYAEVIKDLMASVTCGITCIVAPKYSPRRSFAITSEYIRPVVTLSLCLASTHVNRS